MSPRSPGAPATRCCKSLLFSGLRSECSYPVSPHICILKKLGGGGRRRCSRPQSAKKPLPPTNPFLLLSSVPGLPHPSNPFSSLCLTPHLLSHVWNLQVSQTLLFSWNLCNDMAMLVFSDQHLNQNFCSFEVDCGKASRTVPSLGCFRQSLPHHFQAPRSFTQSSFVSGSVEK